LHTDFNEASDIDGCESFDVVERTHTDDSVEEIE
jgi:hypothetical protein